MASPWDFSTPVWYEQVKDYPTFDPTFSAVDGRLSSGFCAYLAKGQVRKMVTILSGLDHLNGQGVQIVQDGLVSNDSVQTVVGGQIELSVPAAVVHAGLPYIGKIKWLPLGGDSQNVNQTKKRKLSDVVFRLFRSLGGKFGRDEDSLYTMSYDDQILDPLFTGDFHDVPLESSVLDVWEPVFVQDTPLPFMLLAAIMTSEIEEKP